MKHIVSLARKYLPVVGIFALATVAAHAAEGDPDVTAIKDGVLLAKVAILAIASGVIGAGVALGALKWGARWAVGLFKIFMK